jgi:hypothetical protein
MSDFMTELRKAVKKKKIKLLKWQLIMIYNKLTCRTFVSTAEDYLNHLSNCEDDSGNNVGDEILQTIKNVLPNLVWITEISVSDLFCGNKAKLGDVVSRVDFQFKGTTPHDLEAVEFVWFPGFAVIQLMFPTEIEWPLTGYIPLQRPPHPDYPMAEW